MRVQLEIQEGIDLRLEQRDEELCQLRSQSQADGAQLAALSLQLQELISSVESRAEVVGKDLEEINGRFDRHRGEINRLKIWEKTAKEETKELKGFIIGAGHCQEIGLIALMFFFELLFFHVSSSISFYVSFDNSFSTILFPYLLITRDTQDEGEARFDSTDTGNSLK